MTSCLDITRSVGPPRAAFLDFPLGHTTGKAHDAELQRAILTASLSAFEEPEAPGSVKMLPFRWSEDDSWKERVFAGDDERRPRRDTPQYQSEEDRRRAEACGACAPGPGRVA
ncbi:MAG: hypothetical protein ACREQY_13940 [Candidatus Binatia bacterium]